MSPARTLVLLLAAGPAAAEEPEPWRLDEALGLGEGTVLRLDHRARVEALRGRFSRDRPEADHGLFLRTRLFAAGDVGPVRLFGEAMDSRRYGGPADASVTTGQVNPLDLLQAGIAAEHRPDEGVRWSLRAGRQTVDLGSRRLLARNRYRNTINGFLGVTGSVGVDDLDVYAGVLVPVRRRPATPEALDTNGLVLDREAWGRPLAYVQAVRRRLPLDLRLEATALAVAETDTAVLGSRDRRLLTLGGRLLREPAPDTWDAEVEAYAQVGEASPSVAAEASPEPVRAGFLHVHGGWSLGLGEVELRGRAALDVASGGPGHGFDTLYGARRFDVGPTGIYGPLHRTNLVSPEARVTASAGRVSGFVALRHAALASAGGDWPIHTPTYPDAYARRSLGQQLEGRLRFEALPGNLRLEVGAARFWRDEEARYGLDGPDPLYGYAQVHTWL